MTAEKLPAQFNIPNIFVNMSCELASHSCCIRTSHFEGENGKDNRRLHRYIFKSLTDINTSVHV